jgi:hypothetical protein
LISKISIVIELADSKFKNPFGYSSGLAISAANLFSTSASKMLIKK